MELSKEQKLHFWERVNIDKHDIDACWEWKGAKRNNGYGAVMFDWKNYKAHRIAFYLAFGYFPKMVMHKCDNRLCCNPNHLLPGDNKANMRDMRNKGRRVKKLTLEQVAAIRNAQGLQREIADRFGVHQVCVSTIKRGKYYKGVIS